MTGRILQIVVGVMFFLCSTPHGMAQEAIREDVWADFFDGSALDGEGDRQKAASLDGFGLVQLSEGEVEAESSVENEEEAKREHRRISPSRIFVGKCRFVSFLSTKGMSRGMAKHPATQDAGQERTAAVRFLQVAALVC